MFGFGKKGQRKPDHPSNAGSQDGLADATLRAFACTVGLISYPQLCQLVPDAYEKHIRQAASSLGEALVAGGFVNKNAMMGEIVGRIDEVTSTATLEQMVVAPLLFTLHAHELSKGSGRLEETIGTAVGHQMAAYQLWGGTPSSLQEEAARMTSELGLLAGRLDAARR
jgi:hypothetical protein